MKFAAVMVTSAALISVAGMASARRAGWEYGEEWDGLCAAGLAQSPVDLGGPAEYDGGIGEFTFVNYESQPLATNITNNGHTAEVTFSFEGGDDAAGGAPSLSGGGLPGPGDTFRLTQMHFHWGAVDDRGSEHTYGNLSFPLEMHIVHYNVKYGDLAGAAPQPDGLAVLGVLFEMASEDNPKFGPMLEACKRIEEPSSAEASTNLVARSFPVMDFLPANRKNFIRYSGSLTTPPCAESVTWTVFAEPLPISRAQLDSLRRLKDLNGGAMVDNFRPVQPLNDRNLVVTSEELAENGMVFFNSASTAVAAKSYDVYDKESLHYHAHPKVRFFTEERVRFLGKSSNNSYP